VSEEPAVPPWTRLSPSLVWFRDTCNVFLLQDGEHALLIDSGSGAILDHLDELGVRQVDWVLHTHHHRDQAQGAARLAAHGARIGVPEREAALFAQTDAFWRLRKRFDDYDGSSLWNTLARSVPVDSELRDHSTFTWRGHDLLVQPTPGHTKGSVSFLATVDGRACAFTGDVIAAPGRVDTVHELQWQYGMPDAVGAALHTATLLARMPIERLLPSHGTPMDDPPTALRALAGNLRQLYALLGEVRANRVWTTWPHSVDQPKTHVLPHLWANTHALSNTWALVADDGRTLLLDYGFPSWDHVYADLRFVEHTLDELMPLAGITSIDAIIPSHYHDDHLAGVPWLVARHGTQAWIHESFAAILARPDDWKLPCLLPTPIVADRVLMNGERVRFGDWAFDVFHMPGHTWYALGMVGEVDGTRIAFTGDNLLAGSLTPLRAAAPIYRNRMRLDSIRLGVERLIEHEPELLLTGHSGAIPVTRPMLDDFIGWARRLELAFTRLVAVPALIDEALDPDLAWIRPYRQAVAAGGSIDLVVGVTNHAATPAEASVHLALPAGWTAEPDMARTGVGAGETGELRFRVAVGVDAPIARQILTADLVLRGRHYGQRAEAIVDVIASVADVGDATG